MSNISVFVEIITVRNRFRGFYFIFIFFYASKRSSIVSLEKTLKTVVVTACLSVNYHSIVYLGNIRIPITSECGNLSRSRVGPLRPRELGARPFDIALFGVRLGGEEGTKLSKLANP